MAIEVRLPELGGSITHAKLSTWLKQAGDLVTQGEAIAEVETDKTSIEIEAPGNGVLSAIEVAAGTDHVAINDLLAIISAARVPAIAGVSVAPEPVATAPAVSAAPPGEDERPTPALHPHAAETAMGEASEPSPNEADIAASPVARRMAYAAGVRISTLTGTGPLGRIMKADVERVLAPRPPAPGWPPSDRGRTAPPAVPTPQDNPERYDRVTLSPMQRVAAERLTAAKQAIPHFYLHIECAMDAVARIRADANARGGDKLSFTIFALRAAALALKKVPAANAMWDNGTVRRYKTVDLAVAVNTPSGLIAPIIRNAEAKSISALNQEMRALAERARVGRLKPEDYSGGTCTVSNLGMFGITSLYPIINPPQTCILGLGAIEERPVVRDHAVGVGLMMTCTLSADHRALDGAVGAEFLAAFRQLIEDPWSLLL
jgi:pyruvate dehydrogenase E2 component (dihydrolipoamide acetyltransferase)